MAIRSQRSLSSVNIWPGYVDVLATLLIVTIFTVMISTITQLYFNDVIGEKTSEISELDRKIFEIGKNLSMITKEKENLNEENSILQSSIKDLNNKILFFKTDIDRLEKEIKKSNLELEISKDRVSETAKRNIFLIDQIKDKNLKISFIENQIKNKKEEIFQKDSSISNLKKNIEELKNQLLKISKLLEVSEEKDKQNKVIIKNLGKKLNLALAGKVQELSEYQSLFLKKIKKALSNRQDVLVSGDRFILPSEIFFKSADDTLEENAKKELNKIASTLKEISLIIPKEIDWVLRIDGHTDKRPIFNEQFRSNWHLSSARSIRIVNFLIEKGIPPNKLIAAGFGEFSPLTNKNTEEAFRKNRRIEIKLTNK